MKETVVLLELRGSQKFQGTYTMIGWSRAHGYDLIILTITNTTDAVAQAQKLRFRGPFPGVVMDPGQFQNLEEAQEVFDPVAALLMPSRPIVHHVGRPGQTEEQVTDEFLAKYLTKV